MHINNLRSEIKKFYPQALIEVSKEPYEDEDANIEVILPDGVIDMDFELKMAEKSVDLHRKEGYNILILTVSYEVTNAKPQWGNGNNIEGQSSLGREKVQVKVSFNPDSTANRWSYIKDPSFYDSLILIVLSDDYKVQNSTKYHLRKLLL